MASHETNPARLDDSENVLEDVQEERLATLKTEYQRRVEGSKLGRSEKETCLAWLQKGINHEGQSITVKDLEVSLEHFSQNEATSAKLTHLYEEKVADFIRRGLLAPITKAGKDRLQTEVEWFSALPYIDKRRALLQSDIDDPRRVEAAEKFSRLPEVIRKRYQKEWDSMNLEERLTFTTKNLARHEKLKAQFLKLPEDIWKARAEEFKAIDDFDKRELFILQLQKEFHAKQQQQKEKEREAKTRQGETQSITGPSSRPLTSQLSGRETKLSSPSAQVHRQHETKSVSPLSKAKTWLLKFLRTLSLSSKDDASQVIEPFAISAEILKRRKRLEVERNIRDQEKLQKAEKNLGSDRDPFEKEVIIQAKRLRYQRDERRAIKKTLRPEMGNQEAVVSNAKLLSEDGREIGTEEYLHSEMQKQRRGVEKMAVRQALKEQSPFDEKTLKEAALNLTDKEITAATEESIRKAA